MMAVTLNSLMPLPWNIKTPEKTDSKPEVCSANLKPSESDLNSLKVLYDILIADISINLYNEKVRANFTAAVPDTPPTEDMPLDMYDKNKDGKIDLAEAWSFNYIYKEFYAGMQATLSPAQLAQFKQLVGEVDYKNKDKFNTQAKIELANKIKTLLEGMTDLNDPVRQALQVFADILIADISINFYNEKVRANFTAAVPDIPPTEDMPLDMYDKNKDGKIDLAEAWSYNYIYKEFYAGMQGSFSPAFLAQFKQLVGEIDYKNKDKFNTQAKIVLADKIANLLQKVTDEKFCAGPVVAAPGLLYDANFRLNYNHGQTSDPYYLGALTARPNAEGRLRLGRQFADGAQLMAPAQKALYHDPQLDGTSVLPFSVPTDLAWDLSLGGHLGFQQGSNNPKPAGYRLGANRSLYFENKYFSYLPYAGAELVGQYYPQPTRSLFQDPLYLKLSLSPAQFGKVLSLGDWTVGGAARAINADVAVLWPFDPKAEPQLKLDWRVDYLFSSGLDFLAAYKSRVKVNFGINGIWPFSKRRESGMVDYSAYQTTAGGGGSSGSGSNEPLNICMTGEDFSNCTTLPPDGTNGSGQGSSSSSSSAASLVKYNPVKNVWGLDLHGSADIAIAADGKFTLTPLGGYSRLTIGDHTAEGWFAGGKLASNFGTSKLIGSLTGLGGSQKTDPYLPYEGGFGKIIADLAFGQERNHAVSLFTNLNNYHADSSHAFVWTLGAGYRYSGSSREEKKIVGADAYDTPDTATPAPAPAPAPAPVPAPAPAPAITPPPPPAAVKDEDFVLTPHEDPKPKPAKATKHKPAKPKPAAKPAPAEEQTIN